MTRHPTRRVAGLERSAGVLIQPEKKVGLFFLSEEEGVVLDGMESGKSAAEILIASRSQGGRERADRACCTVTVKYLALGTSKR
jgi:hypothetical protein